MANSVAFRETLAIASGVACTHCNVCTGDPGTTGANESAGARGAITWVAGASNGNVVGNELTLTNVPIGTYTYLALFGGSSGSNYQQSYLLPSPITLTAIGPITVNPTIAIPA